MAKTKDRPLRKGDKVIATIDLPGVPEGTKGKIKLLNGFFRSGSWLRYWVFFDNGVDLGSISVDKLVRADQWEAFQVERARRAEEGERVVAAAPAAAAAGSSGGDGEGAGDGAASGPASRIPAHLLERSKSRRQALGQG
jgi:hypothetical protein